MQETSVTSRIGMYLVSSARSALPVKRGSHLRAPCTHPLARGLVFFAVVVALSASFTGCVRRRLTVRSNPPGALVYIDDQEIGTTPVSTSFIYYGTRKIRLVRDGYETVTVLERIRPPWYQHAPLDFFSENLVPCDLRDERVLDFELVPQRVVPTEELLGRAENLRQATRSGYVAPLPTPAESNPGVPIMPDTSPAPTTPNQILTLPPPPPFGQPG